MRVERTRLAADVDRRLRQACRIEAQARLAIGTQAAELVDGGRYRRLGFVRVSDYARERHGISARSLECAARVSKTVAALPATRAAFADGAISWSRLRLLVAVATPDDEHQWLARARSDSFAAFAAAVGARHSGGTDDHDGDESSIDGEPAAVWRVACPSRLRALWRHACELASRMAGEPLASWRAAEIVAAEGIASRPIGVAIGDRVLLAFMRLNRSTAGKPCSGTPPPARTVGARVPPPPTCGRRDTPSSSDPCEIDARLAASMRALRQIEPEIGRLLRVVIDHRLYRFLGFRSLDGYVRERLGISIRKVWALVRIERAIRRTAPLADAYEHGRVSWVRTLALVPVVDRNTAEAWVARATAVTVRRLHDEVNWILDRRDVLGHDASLLPPPLHAPLVQIGAHRRGPASVTKDGTRGAEIMDGEIRFTGPASVVALFRDAADAYALAGEPRWRAVERPLCRVVADWEAEPQHRDPVFARDGWRCTVPACSSRRNLHDHHVRFRSRGGDNRRTNRTTVCAAHHLHGLHAGIIRASGAAPVLRWDLPLFSCIGDVYV